MKHRLIIILAINLLLGASMNSQADTKFFAEADVFFKTYVTNGLVDYKAAKKDEGLSALIDWIAQADVSKIDLPTKKAFFINAYNLLVIHAVLSEYPLKSVLDVKGFFDQKKHRVGGKMVTLDQLEKEWLFALEKDPRFHFVLVCGAKGCPEIAPFAFFPDKLDEQLTNQTRKALNDPEFIRVNRKSVELSQIFQWYAMDFGKNPGEIISYINKYRTNPLSENVKVDYYSYDWSLNNL